MTFENRKCAELRNLMDVKGWTLGDLARELGDSELRLHEVMNGIEPLGKTAELAAMALQQGLQAIEPDSNSLGG